MCKVQIKEKNIKQILAKTDGATVTYTKYGKNDTEYHVRYKYEEDAVPPGHKYCKYCGEFYKEEDDRCHICDNSDYVIDYKAIADEVYELYNDYLSILIEDWDGKIYGWFTKEEEWINIFTLI